MTTSPDPLFLVSDLDLMPDDTNRYEVIEGELLASKATSVDHQIVSSNLHFEFLLYLRANPIGKMVATPGVIFSEIDHQVWFHNSRYASSVSPSTEPPGLPKGVTRIAEL